MATTFTYATEIDLNKYFNRTSDFDSKRQLVGNITTAGNLHIIFNTGMIDALYVNGYEKTKVTDTPDSNNEWQYYEETDQVSYYDSNFTSTTILDQSIEAGVDWETFIDQTLVDASLELHNYLDRRYSTPLQKVVQVSARGSSISTDTMTGQYDPIVIKSVCYIAASNLIRAKEGSSEEADYYYSLVTNPERTGMIDKLNDGLYKLSYEYTNKSKAGKLHSSNVNGTMELIEITGEYTGEKYDVLGIDIDTGGAFGTATFTVKHFGNDKLFGVTTSPEIITGTMQHIYGGIYGRWEGLSANAVDYYEIVVYGDGQKQTNASSGAIELSR